ncbi:MAG: hypothetical protein KatS3mg111_4227 [Pirellulaceae bacterium]|nr:MAG: hypothetical protein KatS3mg111_4227 [Pirellulaceae bacterium]
MRWSTHKRGGTIRTMTHMPWQQPRPMEPVRPWMATAARCSWRSSRDAKRCEWRQSGAMKPMHGERKRKRLSSCNLRT